MATCKMTTSTFSAEPGNLQGIRDGWLAQAADDFIDGKRYTGIDATEVWGTMTNVLRDCPHECDAKGKTFNNVILGTLKSVASIHAPLNPCTALLSLSMSINWVPHASFLCLNQAISWWLAHHMERTFVKPMTGTSPNCGASDSDPIPPYPLDDECNTPQIAVATYPNCLGSAETCTGSLPLPPDPPLNFLFAWGQNGIGFQILDDGNRVEINSSGGAFFQGGIVWATGEFVCCSNLRGQLLAPPLLYSGPPTNPGFPANDSRRYNGTYILTRDASVGIVSANATVTFL